MFRLRASLFRTLHQTWEPLCQNMNETAPGIKP